ncbi:hypothetical protein BGZ54_008519 [Gamsiella multidivaricata]|nr:hypothetical protein BGZ54_008519 [Gamsiella multidivaricata]
MNPEHEDSVITKDLRRQFHRDGFLIVRNALDHEEVEVFRREVDCLVNFLISENIDIMKDYGGVIEPISCGYIDPPVSQMYILSKRPYSALRNLVTEDPDTVVPVLFGKMPALAKHLLPTDTSENPLCLSNGTLLIEPFPIPIDPTTGERLDLPNSLDDLDTHLQLHRGLASLYQGELDRDKALVQAQEKDPFSMLKHKAGRPINVSDPEQWMKRCERQRPVLVDISAGSIVFLSGFVRHCSLGNTSSKFRRAYMPQFSAGKVVTDDGGIVSLAVPCTDHLHDRDQDMDAV